MVGANVMYHSLTDGGCQESSVTEWFHFTKIPVSLAR